MKYSFIKKGDNLFFAFIIPFVLHGCYNLFISSNFLVAVLLIIISWIIALRMFSRLKKTQMKKRKESWVCPVGDEEGGVLDKYRALVTSASEGAVTTKK